MLSGILGKKLGMSQLFKEDGAVIPVTVIEAGPCAILQVKDKEKDGYMSVQLAFNECREKVMNKPELTRFKKNNITPRKFVREVRVDSLENLSVGQNINVEIFKPGDYVDIEGTSIGKGFQGGMKRWNWSGGPGGHGSMSHRRPGSIGSNTDPGRVFKGQHMAGRLGAERVTVQNLEVIRIDKEKNILIIRGAVPGKENSYLIIRKAKKK